MFGVCCVSWQTERISIICFLFLGFGWGCCKKNANANFYYYTIQQKLQCVSRWGAVLFKMEIIPLPLSIVSKRRYCKWCCESWHLYDVAWIMDDVCEIIARSRLEFAGMMGNEIMQSDIEWCCRRDGERCSCVRSLKVWWELLWVGHAWCTHPT